MADREGSDDPRHLSVVAQRAHQRLQSALEPRPGDVAQRGPGEVGREQPLGFIDTSTPAASVHEEDRLSILWSLDYDAPICRAVRARCATAVDRVGGGSRGTRCGWRILSRPSLCPVTRVSLP